MVCRFAGKVITSATREYNLQLGLVCYGIYTSRDARVTLLCHFQLSDHPEFTAGEEKFARDMLTRSAKLITPYLAAPAAPRQLDDKLASQ